LLGAASQTIEPGSFVRSDGWDGYNILASHGYEHSSVLHKDAETGDATPLAHRVAALLKRCGLERIREPLARASGLLPRRIHFPLQSQNFQIARQAVLPLDRASSTNRTRARQILQTQHVVVAGANCIAPFENCLEGFAPLSLAVSTVVRASASACAAHMMMWTASPHRHHSAKAWSPERHKEGDVHEEVYQNRRRSGQELFSVHALESENGRAVTRKLKRSKMHEFFSQIEPCLIGLEACGSAHYWARELKTMDTKCC